MKIRNLLLSLLAASSIAVAASSQAQETVESTFVMWNNGSFDRFIVEKHTNYNQFNKVIVLPLKYDELVVETGKSKKLRKNWEGFAEEDMPALATRFAELAANEFEKDEGRLVLTENGGEDVLLISVNLLRLEPLVYRDSSMATVGEETFEVVGFLDYQVTIMDSKGGIVAGLIEDSIKVALRRKSKNIRGNHFRAWVRTFEHILEKFNDDMMVLSANSPIGNS